MRISALVVSAMLCAGCAPLPPFATKDDDTCKLNDNDADCVIPVVIDDPQNGKCSVRVASGLDSVGFAGTAKDKFIYWRIPTTSSENFRFPNDGIDPKDDKVVWNDNFSGGPIQGGAVFKLKNKNKAKVPPADTEYRYTVRVEKKQPHGDWLPCTAQDPVIKNQS